MRRAFVVIGLGLVWAQAPAPQGGDACGYRWYTHLANVPDSTPTFSWVDISTTGQLLSGLKDDNFVGPINLPTPFVYYWNTYSKVYVGSNGYIVFGRGANVASGGPPYFQRFPNSASPNEWVGVYLADLTFEDNNGAPIPSAKLLYGTDAQGRFVITWDSVPYWNGNAPGQWSGRNSFQIILDPNDSSITLQYKYIDAGYHSSYSDGNYNVVGMENITGQSGLDIAAAWPVPFQDYAIKIWHPRTFTCTSLDVQADWVLNANGMGRFALKGGVSPTFTAGVLNAGNQVISNQIRAILNLRGPLPSSNAIIHRDTVFLQPPLNVGQLAAATYTKPFDHNVVGTPSNLKTGSYNCITSLTLSGDGYPGNNSNYAELVIADSNSTGTYKLRFDDGSWDPQNEFAGGVGTIANGMAIVAPENIIVEAVSLDMLYEDAGANNYPVTVWVYNYDPINGSVGPGLDTLTLDPVDFPNGDTLLGTFSSQSGSTFYLRRYTLPLHNPINLSAGQGLLVGFLTAAPPNASQIGNYVVEDLSIPISRASFEGIAGAWAPYRDLENVDYAVGVVARRPTTSSVNTLPAPPRWQVSLFPNPTSASPYLRFELPKAGPVQLRVIDLTGRTLYQEELLIPSTSYKKQLPCTLTPGTYLVAITYEGYTITHRLLIK